MIVMTIILDGTKDPSGPPFDAETVLHVKDAVALIGMPAGTAEGRPTVIIRATLPDDSGREVFVETSLRLLETAVKAMRAYYGPDPEDWKPHAVRN